MVANLAETNLRIAEVARLCGVSTSTLRVWEQHGLISPNYTSSGHRLFTEKNLEEIRDIQRLRVVQGLSLSAIRAMRGRSIKTKLHRHHAPINLGIGGKLRALRKTKGMSLRHVAAETALSYSFISTLERTSLGASAASIRKLATFYGTTVTELSSEIECHRNQKPETVVRSGKGRDVPMLGPEINIKQLASGNVMMDCQKWILQPGAESGDAYSHEGEEFIYVLNGKIEIKLDGREIHLLGQGDSIYFQSTRIHAWRNPGEEEVEVIWVNTPPTF